MVCVKKRSAAEKWHFYRLEKVGTAKMMKQAIVFSKKSNTEEKKPFFKPSWKINDINLSHLWKKWMEKKQRIAEALPRTAWSKFNPPCWCWKFQRWIKSFESNPNNPYRHSRPIANHPKLIGQKFEWNIVDLFVTRVVRSTPISKTGNKKQNWPNLWKLGGYPPTPISKTGNKKQNWPNLWKLGGYPRLFPKQATKNKIDQTYGN